MSYSEPQLNIYQEFVAALDANVTPLYACIIGPKYGLHRFGVEGEEESVGSYDPSVVNVFDWPGKASGSVVDQDSAKVFAKNALLEYYSGADFAVPTGQTGSNEIKTDSLTLQSKNGYSRSSVFGNRDVTVGDRVRVSWDGVTVDTMITALQGEIGSIVDPAEADANNQIANAAAVAPNVTEETVADSNLTLAAGGTYSGIADGYIEETYVVRVLTTGVVGVAKAAVISSSGSDDVTEIVLADDVAVGTRGITLSITDAGSGEFVVGETITIYAKEAYALPTLTSGGDFTGDKNTTYIVQLTEGGVVGTDTPKFKVTTTNGYDIQDETPIVAGAVVIGNYGVTLTFVDADQLVKGDAWTISVTPEAERAIKTIKLSANLVADGNSATDSDTLDVKLMIEDTVEIDAEYVDPTEYSVEVSAHAATEDLYLDKGADLPIIEAELFIEYREALGGSVEFGSVNDPLDVADVLGPVTPANELSYGMYKAVQNSNGVPVYYVSVPTNDVAGYITALDRISVEELIWSIVPLTKDAAVLSITKAFIIDQSSPINNNWKKGWFNSNAEQTNALYTELDNGDPIQATIRDDAGGSNYVNVFAEGADFNAAGVQEGDTLKYNAHPVDGVTVWDEATIKSVGASGEELVLKSSAIEMTIPADIEVWRTANLQDYADIIAAESSAYGNRRINNIWPDVIPDELGEEVEGYFLCAALAAYRSASAPHQPLTRAEITGFGVPNRSLQFSRTQLNTIAAGGTWIVTSNIKGAVFTRHQLTTDMTNEETQEDSITSNLDSISRVYKEAFDPLIGKSNVTPDMLELLEGRIFTSFKFIHNLPYSRELGPQMLGYELLELAQDPILKSKVRIRIKPELAMPLNYLDLFLYIG